jgi:hypothetical protein
MMQKVLERAVQSSDKKPIRWIPPLTEQERAELRLLIEECEIVDVGDDVREYVEREMPDLISRLPPRTVH